MMRPVCKLLLAMLLLVGISAACACALADTAVTEYYGDQLNPNQRVFYEQYLTLPAEDGVYTLALPDPIPLENEKWREQYLIDSYCAADYDHPERVAWIPVPFELVGYDVNENTVTVSVSREIYYSETDHENAMKVLRAIADGADPAWDSWTKIDYIEKMMASILKYESSITSGGKSFYTLLKYTSVLSGRAICEGYAETFKILADMIGLPCVEVGSVGHAWVHVRMEDGKWYGVEPQNPYARLYSLSEMLGWNYIGDADMYELYDGLFAGGTVTEPERCDERYPEPVNPVDVPLTDLSGVFAEIHAGDTVLQYEVLDDGISCRITGFEGGGSGDIAIPVSMDGYTVTEIGAGAFENAYYFEGALILPDTLEVIHDRAFYNCRGLIGDLVIPESVKRIGDYAFSNCSGFNGQIYLHEGLESVGTWAFAWCESLTGSLILPETLQDCRDTAFSYLFSMTGELYIPRGIDGPNGWVSSTPFSSVAIADDHPTLTLLDGILYSRDRTELVYCPPGRQGAVVIPEGVAVLRDLAFYHCHEITSIRLPDTLTSIGRFALALSDSARLQGGLPASLEHIGRCGFQSCQLGDVLHYPCTDDVSEEAFNWIQGANKIVVPEGVTRLPDGFISYLNDTSAKVIVLPSTLREVGSIDNMYGLATQPLRIIAPESIRGTFDLWIRELRENGQTCAVEYYDDVPYFLSETYVTLSLLPEDGNMSRRLELHAMDDSIPDGVSWEISDDGVATVSGDGTVTAVGPGSAILTARYGSIALQATVYVHDGIEYSPDGKTLLHCSENYAGCVDIPEGVEEIAKRAFADCARVTEIRFPETLRRIGERAFVRAGYGLEAPLTIPNTITYIGPYAYNVASIRTSTLLVPNCTLGEGAFSMAGNFSRVVLSYGIAEVPSRCFAYTYIQEIVVPKTVTRISPDAFSNRYAGNRLVIVGEEGSYAQEFAAQLAVYDPSIEVVFQIADPVECAEHIEVYDAAVAPTCTQSGLTEGRHCAICGAVLAAQQTIPATGHGEVIDPAVPATHVTTGLTAGSHCPTCGEVLSAQQDTPVVDVQKLVLPAELAEIEAEAFAGSGSICIVLPEICTEIGAAAFRGCAQLRFIEIPGSVRSIDGSAFEGCSEGLIIVTDAGSAAERFAREKGIVCVLR